MVFPEVNFPGYHTEGRKRVRGRGGNVLSTGTSDCAGYCGVGGRHGGVSVAVGGVLKLRRK